VPPSNLHTVPGLKIWYTQNIPKMLQPELSYRVSLRLQGQVRMLTPSSVGHSIIWTDGPCGLRPVPVYVVYVYVSWTPLGILQRFIRLVAGWWCKFLRQVCLDLHLRFQVWPKILVWLNSRSFRTNWANNPLKLYILCHALINKFVYCNDNNFVLFQ